MSCDPSRPRKFNLREYHNEAFEHTFSGLISEKEILDIILGWHHISVAKKDNLHWAPFVSRIRERQDELTPALQRTLDWLLEVHCW